MRGITGIIHYHLDCYKFLSRNDSYESAKKLLDNLMFFEISNSKYNGFPGEQLYRLSHDYFTGTSGILLLLKRFYSLYTNNINTNQNFYLDNYYFED